jgi:hypothetical protein
MVYTGSMTRWHSLIGLTVLLLAGFARGSGGTPEGQLEEARKLRAQKQPQAALALLEKLAKNRPEELDKAVRLELAGTRVQLAQQADLEQRPAILQRARDDLLPLLEDIKTSDPLAVMQAAHVAGSQGKTLLRLGRRTDDAAAADHFRAEASKHFAQAGKWLTDIDKRLSAVHDKTEARLERGQMLTAQAGAYTTNSTADKRGRAELLLQARNVLEAIIRDFAKDVQEPNVYMARAWLVCCCKESGDGVRSQGYYKELIAESRPEAAAAKRWGQAFFIQGIRLDKAGLPVARKEAEQWLKTYPAFRDAPEGAIVRYQLASALAIEAQLVSKDVNHPEAGKLYDLAQQEFAAVALLDSDQAEKAGEYALNLRFLRIGSKTPLDSLKDFESCFLRARFEMGQLQEVSAKLAQAPEADRGPLETQRQARAQECALAFERALTLNDKTATPQRVAEVRYLLARCYMAGGQADKALEASEALGHASPPTKYSAQAASYALEIAAVLRGRKDTPQLRQRSRALAEFVLKDRKTEWQNDAVTGQAHYQLGMLAAAERKYGEAVTELEQLAPAFRHYFYARCQLAFLALAARKTAGSEAERQKLATKALTVLKDLPPLPARSTPEAVGLYFTAHIETANAALETAADRLEVGPILEAVQMYADLLARSATVREQLEKLDPPLEAETREPLAKALTDIKSLSVVGLARAEARAGNYDKVLKDTGPTIKELLALSKDEKATTPIQIADSQTAGDVLGIALRAHIQKGNVAEARKIMLLLRRLTDEKGTQIGTEVLGRLVNELKLELRDQRKAGDKDGLRATMERFDIFLQALGKDDPKLIADRQFLVFLATSYASLDKNAEAAKLFAKIPEPKFDPKKKLTPQEQRELDDYWLLQATYARSLRQAKQYGEARKVLERILKESRFAGRFQAEKEINHLLEDEGDYGRAVTAWSDYLENPGLREVLVNPRSKAGELRTAKELYFDGYYHFIWCYFQFGKTHKTEAKRKEFIDKAGSMIAGLEAGKDRDGWEIIGPRLEELMSREPTLRSAFVTSKGK